MAFWKQDAGMLDLCCVSLIGEHPPTASHVLELEGLTSSAGKKLSLFPK